MVDLRLQSYVQFNYLISADEEWSKHVVTNKWLQNRVFFFFFLVNTELSMLPNTQEANRRRLSWSARKYVAQMVFILAWFSSEVRKKGHLIVYFS